jgi:tRNA (adenine57-N1/adenine58-N1)-methyltransferase
MSEIMPSLPVVDATNIEMNSNLYTETTRPDLKSLKTKKMLAMASTLSSSAEEKLERASFIHYREHIEEGDTVILWVDPKNIKSIIVQRGKTISMKNGALRHEFLINKRYGSRISATAGHVYALRPNPTLWSKALIRHTQILYSHDIATIIHLLDIKPGSVICESGTGSASLTHALAVACGHNGHVYTHDIVEERVKSAEKSLQEHGLGIHSTVDCRNVCEEPFFVSNSCDGVFLDLPEPWKAIKHAKDAISRNRGGRLVNFSPCIEQVLRVVEELEKHDFQFIETIELVPKTLKVVTKKQRAFESFADEPMQKKFKGDKIDSTEVQNDTVSATTVEDASNKGQNKVYHKKALVPVPSIQPSHSGYLTSATLLPY